MIIKTYSHLIKIKDNFALLVMTTFKCVFNEGVGIGCQRHCDRKVRSGKQSHFKFAYLPESSSFEKNHIMTNRRNFIRKLAMGTAGAGLASAGKIQASENN